MNTPTAKRTALMAYITRLAQRKTVYIHAPAGYGKSFSIRSWANNSNLPYARVASNEEFDQKPLLFYENLAAAFLKLQKDNDALRAIVNHPSFLNAPVEYVLRIPDIFTANAGKYILIIDDLHLITNTEITKMLMTFIKLLPDNIILFILSRVSPPHYFSEMVIKNELAVMETDALLFSAEEIKSLFSASGHPITAKQAEEIRSSTGGWAIAINAIILTGSESSVKKIAKQHWETFIRNEVWDKWGDTVKTLMMKASISDKITPQLCDALTDRKDSAAILNQLVMENAFLSTDDGENFYFHHLFRQFLMHMLEQESQKTQNALYKKAGAYFYHKKEYYNAVRYYLKSDNSSGVSKSLKHMYDYNSPYAAIEDTLAIVKQSVDGSIIDKYPFLLEVQAWAAFVEGRAKDMEAILDRYYKLFPKIVLQNPPSVQTMFMLRCMDYRNNLIDIAKSVKMLPLKYLAKAGTPSLTNNQPFFHRSIRDFTEFLTDTDTNFALLKKTLGAVIGDEFDTIENGIRAGLHYEQGDMQKAHAYALEANAGIREHFSPEIKFCALVILAEIYYETKQTADLQKTLANITAMIERNRAYYLGANYQAYLCRRKLNDGDEAAAKKWLRDYPADTQKELSYFKLIQHFITARAYITAGDYGTAILFIKRLLALCEAYRRPIDIIESRILLAIAYWKKGRGFQGDALHVITDAIVSAYRYGYTQVFANEGAELVNMLHRLHLAAAVKDYSGVLPGAFAKTLYIMALSRSKITKGLTGGRLIKPLTFTEQQKAVMRLLCEGQSQQAAADKLGLKVTGIKSHLQLIYKKLDVSNGVDAVMKIKELGLL